MRKLTDEDRDILRYPSSSFFEIELPEDLLNVASLRLFDWAFPCNYNTFSGFFSNTKMTFKINNPYDPNIHSVGNLLIEKIFEYLKNSSEMLASEGFELAMKQALIIAQIDKAWAIGLSILGLILLILAIFFIFREDGNYDDPMLASLLGSGCVISWVIAALLYTESVYYSLNPEFQAVKILFHLITGNN